MRGTTWTLIFSTRSMHLYRQAGTDDGVEPAVAHADDFPPIPPRPASGGALSRADTLPAATPRAATPPVAVPLSAETTGQSTTGSSPLSRISSFTLAKLVLAKPLAAEKAPILTRRRHRKATRPQPFQLPAYTATAGNGEVSVECAAAKPEALSLADELAELHLRDESSPPPGYAVHNLAPDSVNAEL